jgi:uroporphyrinogen decarboxylase
MKMTAKERLKKILNFEKPDRIWRFYTIGFWKETIERWHNEGLPKYVNNDILAFAYFRVDPMIPISIGSHLNPNLYPEFEVKLIKESKDKKIMQNEAGNIIQVFSDGKSTIPSFIDFPVKNIDDFNKLKWRLNPNSKGRIENTPYNKFNFLIHLTKSMKWPLNISFCGLFGMGRHLMGFENFLYAIYDNEELIFMMNEEWAKLCKSCIYKISKMSEVSHIGFWEDMCYKNGPMISPEHFRKFMTPYYKEVTDFAKEQGIKSFWVDTDGNCEKLVSPFIEAGVNCLWPFEVQAGMDIREIRKKHKKLCIMGGIDKRCLAKSKKEIDDEVLSKAPELLKQGGYIPTIDHCVPPDVPLENFKYYIKLLHNIG